MQIKNKAILLGMFSVAAILVSPVYVQAAQVLSNDQIFKINDVKGVGECKEGEPVGTCDPNEVVLHATKTMQAGEKLYFYAKGNIKSSSAGNMMFGLGLSCSSPNPNDATKPLVQEFWSTRNHEGNDSYAETNGVLQLETRYLFEAPSAGKSTCTLIGKNLKAAGAEDDAYWTLLKGAENTSLSWSSSVSGSDAWATENDDTDKDYAVTGGMTEEAAAKAYPDYRVHVGPNVPAGTRVYALRSNRWKSSTSASSVKAIGDSELTSCHYGTGSCPAYAQDADTDKRAGSLVSTRLVVQQISDTTPSCNKKFYFPADQSFVQTKITYDAHHQKIYHSIDGLPKTQDCSADSYYVSKVEVKWESGNPIQIEGKLYSQNILMNNY